MTEFKRTLAVNQEQDVERDELQDTFLRDGVEGVKQELRTTLLTIQGEDPFDPDHGLALFDVLSAPDTVLEREVRLALNRDDRVERVTDFSVEQAESSRRGRNVYLNVELVDETVVSLGVTMDE